MLIHIKENWNILINFLIQVRKNLLSAALAIVNFHGRETINSVLPIFEEFLDKAPNSSSYDAVRQSVIILMGSLARHLDKDDAKIKPIVDRLIDALSTPSQQVRVVLGELKSSI